MQTCSSFRALHSDLGISLDGSINFYKKETYVGRFKDSSARHTRARNIKEDASLNLGSGFSELHHSNLNPPLPGADASQSPSSQQSLQTTPGSNHQPAGTGVVLPRKNSDPLLACPVPQGMSGRSLVMLFKKPCEPMYPKSVNGSA